MRQHSKTVDRKYLKRIKLKDTSELSAGRTTFECGISERYSVSEVMTDNCYNVQIRQ